MPPPSAATSKLKVALRLAIQRLRMAQQKETALSKVARRQMAQLLETQKEESARIRVENIIRQDISVELMEILELYCELLLARIGLMESKECDPGLEEAVKSLIYAAPRTEIKELAQVRALLVEKYGKEFALAAIENSDAKVAPRVLKKLRVEPPDPMLVTLYLKEIARAYSIPYHTGDTPPPEENDDDDDAGNPSGGVKEPVVVSAEQEELAKATPPRGGTAAIHVAPQSPTSENVRPVIKLPDPPKFGAQRPQVVKKATPPAPAPALPDDNDLARRFAALKR